MLTGCFRCKREYDPVKEHPHYCNDCVKVCANCGELKTVYAFSYKDEWKPKAGFPLQFGKSKAENHIEICGLCESLVKHEMEKIDPRIMEILRKAARK